MDIEESIEAIESGYEFLLAYAAQGRPASDETGGPGPHARPTIEGMASAMKHVTEVFADSNDDFEQLIAQDCKKAGAAMGFMLSQEKLGSEVVDNLNASIHLRAVLTDLFLYSEALRPLATEEESGVMAHDAMKKQ
ncbi:MAG: hypothetical protein P8N28_02020 [Phycisphaerales bacterium]|jgi:hypothetical protein|nr:hypothetical protein [Phycisphaerales bacterium]MDG2249672.1 hypothetical protein [Gammaproteobacteria bacterium]|tara:strand:- start:86 stop:493 length:408 start_codon:yes stop_codon:yes gene_type:complete